jgi:transposase-like protein
LKPIIEQENVTWQIRGEWMRPASKLKGNGFTIIEQSHRKVKGKMHQCLGWKSWIGAEATLAGVELCSMLKQGQMIDSEYKAEYGSNFIRLQHSCL